MKFSDVIGQQEVRDRLLQMVREGRLPHALMLCGPQGSGKMALALAFASYLLCPGHDGGDDRCGACPQCRMLDRLEHPDLHFTFPTIKLPSMGADHKPVSDDFIREWHALLSRGPYFTMEQWLAEMGATTQQAVITAGESDALTHKLTLKSSQGGYKVSLIWLPERMNGDCANKMLKLIEEPPSQTVFLMVCEEPDKLLETIRSRTQRVDVHRIDADSMAHALEERRGIGEEAARRVARIAAGDWLKALETLDADNENAKFFEQFVFIMRAAYQKDVRKMKAWSEEMAGYGRERQKRFLAYFLRMVRENFAYNFRDPALNYMTEQEEAFAKNFARFVNEVNVIGLMDMANTALRDIAQNANAKIVFFDIALRLTVFVKQGVAS